MDRYSGKLTRDGRENDATVNVYDGSGQECPDFHPEFEATANAVSKAMDLIVSNGIFAFQQGAIVKKVDAVQVSTDSATIA